MAKIYNQEQTVVLWTEPQVSLIQHSIPMMPTLDSLALEAGEGQHDWEPDARELELAPIFAGRACYQSFGDRAGRKTAEDYLGHILDVGHFSILEHSSVSFYLQGVSRSFSHELIRHRMASYSQLSQRFVPYDECLPLVIHPNIWNTASDKEKEDVILNMTAYGDEIRLTYKYYIQKYAEKWGYETFAQKKKVRETAREFLPNMTETKIVVTMNLRSWLEMLSKRNSEAADGQIHAVASKIKAELVSLAPNVFSD